jgi:hypothetical protein
MFSDLNFFVFSVTKARPMQLTDRHYTSHKRASVNTFFVETPATCATVDGYETPVFNWIRDVRRRRIQYDWPSRSGQATMV